MAPVGLALGMGLDLELGPGLGLLYVCILPTYQYIHCTLQALLLSWSPGCWWEEISINLCVRALFRDGSACSFSSYLDPLLLVILPWFAWLLLGFILP